MTPRPLAGSAAFAVLALAAAPALAGAQDSAVAFRDVTVLPMAGPLTLPHQSVIVRGDRIVALGSVDAVAIPPGSTLVEGAGKYLMPGLVDMHVHLPGSLDSSGLVTRNDLALFVAYGVTTVRVLNGVTRHLAWRDSVARETLIGPKLYVVGSAIGGMPDNTEDMRRVLNPSETARFAQGMKDEGYDFIQVNGNMQRQEYDALAGAARRVGIPLAGAVPLDVGLDRVIKAHQASIENLDGYLIALERDDSPLHYADPVTRSRQLVRFYDPGKIARLGASLRDANVANTPTLFINHVTWTDHDPDEMAAWPEMRYMAPTTVQAWIRNKRRATEQQPDPGYGTQYLEFRNRVTRGLANAGAPILAGSDALGAFLVPGVSTLYELHSLTVAGLTSTQALEAATRTAARFVGAEREFGAVAAGMRADLLLLDANPLDDISNLALRAGVMVRGRWFPKSVLDEMLERVEASYKGPETRDERRETSNNTLVPRPSSLVSP